MDQDFQAGRKGLEYAAKRGLGTAIMEPLRGGCLTRNIPEDIQALWNRAENRKSLAEWALRFLWDQEDVNLVLSGMNTMEDVIENVEIAERGLPGSLTEEDKNIIDEVKDAYKSRVHVWAQISHLTQFSSIFAGLVDSASCTASTGHSSAQRLHLTHSGDMVMNRCLREHSSISGLNSSAPCSLCSFSGSQQLPFHQQRILEVFHRTLLPPLDKHVNSIHNAHIYPRLLHCGLPPLQKRPVELHRFCMLKPSLISIIWLQLQIL